MKTLVLSMLTIFAPVQTSNCPLWGGPFVTVPECGTCETTNRQIQNPQCETTCMLNYINADFAACEAADACKNAAKTQYLNDVQAALQSYQQCLQNNTQAFCDEWLQSMMDTLKQAYRADMEACANAYVNAIGAANGVYFACMIGCCKTCNLDLP